MFGSSRSHSAFETHIGNDRRNPAAPEKFFFWLEAGQGSFDNFDRGCGNVVFRTQRNDGAAAVKNVANELESRGAHQAVRIDAKCDVVNDLAAVHGFRNHELLVFRPGKLRGYLRVDRTCGLPGIRRPQQLSNHGVERIHGRRFLAALVGGEHRAKTVGGGQNELGQLGAAGLRDLWRQHIFQFVGKFTEFVKTAGGGIALQGVDGAANAANDFLIGGTRLELKPRLIEGLENLVGALKESAQLAAAVLGSTTHVVASLR
jgi:hypothetical protein